MKAIKSHHFLGLDLVRILAMMIITTMHFAYYQHLGRQFNEMPIYNKIFITTIDVFSKCFINLFVMLSGYLLCTKKRNWYNIIRIWSMSIFAAYFMFFLMTIFVPNSLSISVVVHSLFPIFSCSYWYITIYLILYVMSPAFNNIILSVTRRTFRNYLIFFTIIFTIVLGANPLIADSVYVGSAQSILWFCYLYFIGSYVKLYGIELKRSRLLIFSVVIYFVMFILIYKRIVLPANTNIIKDTGILPLFLSVGLFSYLCTVKVNSGGVISYVSRSSLFVYLIQEAPQFRSIFWPELNLLDMIRSPKLILTWVGVVVLLFCAASAMNYIYNLLYKFISLKFCSKFDKILPLIHD